MSPIASKMIKAIRSSPFYSFFQRLYRLGTTGEHWARVVMEQDTRNLISDLHPERLDVLEISGSQWQEKDLFKSYQHVSYPDFDICQTPSDKSSI